MVLPGGARDSVALPSSPAADSFPEKEAISMTPTTVPGSGLFSQLVPLLAQRGPYHRVEAR